MTVVVTDDGAPPQSASNTFTVTVNEVNLAPTMPLMTNRTVIAGDPLTFTVNGSDADLPAQTLTYTLLPGAPDGATITPGVSSPGRPPAARAHHECHPGELADDGARHCRRRTASPWW